MAFFNITGENARLRAQVVALAKMKRFELWMTVKTSALLNRQYMSVAKLVEDVQLNIDAFIDTEQKYMKALYSIHYKRVGATFSADVFNEFNNAKNTRVPELKGMIEEFWVAFNLWTKNNTASKVVLVNETTKRLLNQIIRRGVGDGKSYSEIAKDIRKARKNINRKRALRIARTETHSAMNFAIDQSVLSTRIEFIRDWLSMKDGRTRNAHILANGQKQPQGVAFDVGGEKLMYPGDPKGSAKNIIHCRCVLLYHTVKNGRRQ